MFRDSNISAASKRGYPQGDSDDSTEDKACDEMKSFDADSESELGG